MSNQKDQKKINVLHKNLKSKYQSDFIHRSVSQHRKYYTVSLTARQLEIAHRNSTLLLQWCHMLSSGCHLCIHTFSPWCASVSRHQDCFLSIYLSYFGFSKIQLSWCSQRLLEASHHHVKMSARPFHCWLMLHESRLEAQCAARSSRRPALQSSSDCSDIQKQALLCLLTKPTADVQDQSTVEGQG